MTGLKCDSGVTISMCNVPIASPGYPVHMCIVSRLCAAPRTQYRLDVKSLYATLATKANMRHGKWISALMTEPGHGLTCSRVCMLR